MVAGMAEIHRLPGAATPVSRIRARNEAPVRPDGELVLYWMIAARRTRSSFALQRAIDDLPPRARQVLRMRWLEERPNADVARMLGLSVKTVEMHVTRALAALRGRLAGG